VNGDGYGDLFIGSDTYDQGVNPNNGVADVYYGSLSWPAQRPTGVELGATINMIIMASLSLRLAM
jgi:hypothetical protein